MAGVVDLHAHVVLADAFETAGPYGPFHGDDADGAEFFRVGDYTMKPIPYRGSVFMDVERRLTEMDRVGIERQMLSPNPLTFFGGVEPAPAIDFARATNDAMAALVAAAHRPAARIGAAPDCRIPTRRSPNSIGRSANSASSPVTSAPSTAWRSTIPDSTTSTIASSSSTSRCSSTASPTTGEGRRPTLRLRRFGLDLIVGYTYEETLAAASLVLGGVLDRHPRLDVCLSHGGGAIAFLAQRFDSMATFRGAESDFADVAQSAVVRLAPRAGRRTRPRRRHRRGGPDGLRHELRGVGHADDDRRRSMPRSRPTPIACCAWRTPHEPAPDHQCPRCSPPSTTPWSTMPVC